MSSTVSRRRTTRCSQNEQERCRYVRTGHSASTTSEVRLQAVAEVEAPQWICLREHGEEPAGATQRRILEVVTMQSIQKELKHPAAMKEEVQVQQGIFEDLCKKEVRRGDESE